ncbi:MAG: M23 family metallopeptidase [Chloroherpetonaceae bacterium]|nr:M23 family metallopeptidase [Chloroherpetonaceae bacterium]
MSGNKYYFYSEEECRYIEVRRNYASLFGKAAVVLILSAALAGGFIKFYGGKYFADAKQKQLEAEIVRLTDRLNMVSQSLAQISETGNKLRNAVNLPLQSVEEIAFGRGGNRRHWQTESTELAMLNESSNQLAQLELQIKEQTDNISEILEKYEQNKRFFACLPAIRPVAGDKTSDFGMRLHPIYRIMKFHSGQDFSAPLGTDVYATGDGIVETSGFMDGYGMVVIINHGFGYKTVYAHLSKTLVKEGTSVQRGLRIGLSGNSGISESPHLHYEVIKNGNKVNPSQFFFDDMTPAAYNTALKTTLLSGIPEENADVQNPTPLDGSNIGH